MTANPPAHRNAALSLATAMVEASTAPLLLLDGALNVIAGSLSFCRAFAVSPAGVVGANLLALGSGEWNAPRLRSLLTATASGQADIDAYEMDLVRPGQDPRRLVLHAHRLAYGADDPVRLLLTVTDVTDARRGDKQRDDLIREKDDLIRDKGVLLREVQHRVANSLQIIASVLMQSARKVSSEETRLHLHDAHNRVMSIAAVQSQLATSFDGDVALRGYFAQLCESLGASMIHDHRRLTIGVSVDETVVGPDVSVSLGLIVTELVINALKHAFPSNRAGTIKVAYRAHGGGWTLSVTDDGIGMADPDSGGEPKAGLGTSIVEALASQLHARIVVADARPGTAISIVNTEAAATERQPRPLATAV